MGVKSLRQMAETVAIKNISYIDDVGDIPFWVLKNILEKIKDPDQLLALEEVSPHLREDSVYIWRRFIERDFRVPADKKQLKVDDPTETYTLYYRYKQEEEDKIAQDLAMFKMNMKASNPKPTTNMLLPASKAPRVPGGYDRSRFYSKYAGKTKQQIGLAKALNKAQQISRAHRITERSLSYRPSTSRMTKAPAAMIRDHEIAKQPSVATAQVKLRIRAPPRIKPTTNPLQVSREERLRRIKEGKLPVAPPEESNAVPTPVSDTANPKQASLRNSARPVAPGPTRRGSGLLSFSPGINANLKITRVPANPTPARPPPSESDRAFARASFRPGRPLQPRHASPPAAAGPASATSPTISEARPTGQQRSMSPPAARKRNMSPPVSHTSPRQASPPSVMGQKTSCIDPQCSPQSPPALEPPTPKACGSGPAQSPPPPPKTTKSSALMPIKKRKPSNNIMRTIKRQRTS